MLDTEISINFREVWDRHLPELSPFCIDFRQSRVVFVRVPGNVDLTAAPFYYDAQRKHAISIYCVAFEQFYELAEELNDDPGNTGFLFSTGRCGSTLLVKLLGTSSQVMAISEPDIYTQVLSAQFSPEDAARILRCTTRVLATIHRRRCPDATFLLIKLRSQCVYFADHFRHADSRYRNLFLYRNAVDVVNSFYALLPSWVRVVLRLVPIDHWILSGSRVRSRISALCPLLLDRKFGDLRHSCFNICVLMWLSSMDSALRLQNGDEPFFEAVLRYEDLIVQRKTMLVPLFERWRVTQPDAAALDEVFGKDSQSGAHIERQRARTLNRSDLEKLRSIVARHPLVSSPGHRLDTRQLLRPPGAGNSSGE